MISAIVGVSIFINDKKIGVVDNGNNVFAIIHRLLVGNINKLEKIEVKILEKEQVKLEIHFNIDRLNSKVELILNKGGNLPSFFLSSFN